MLLPLAALLLVFCAQERSGAGEAEASPASVPLAAPTGPTSPLGPGFLVWESNRTGNWRLFRRDLDGGGLRQLTREEGDRQHCCPHVSPDGRWIAYLSLPRTARDRFPDGGYRGELRLLAADGSSERVVVAAARGYGDNRAAVWAADGGLIHIREDGHTWWMDVASGEARRLTRQPMADHGWLIDPTLAHATTALPSFSRFSPDGAIRQLPFLVGCEPYFTHDGRWGFWAIGGGPVLRIDLASRRVETMIAREDPRLPAGRRYVYFPMVSRNGRLLALAASEGERDFYHADYEVFVAEIDPRTLEVVGPFVQLTRHPATDRFPDVFQPALDLGRWHGEAPAALRLAAPAPSRAREWRWTLGDGATARGAAVEHRWRQPGTYAVTASDGGRQLWGLVTVAPRQPPRVAGVEARERGREVVVRFDEPVTVEEPSLAFASGLAVAGWRLGEDGRELHVRTARPLAGREVLRLAGGIHDRAAPPNPLAPTEVGVAPPLGPVRPEAVALHWRPETDGLLVPRSGARFTAGAAVTESGSFLVAPETADAVVRRLRGTFELTLAATVTAARGDQDGPAWILHSGPPRGSNVALGQRGDRLVLRLRTPETGAEGAEVELFALPAGRATQVVVTYVPGWIAAYRDGELMLESGDVSGGLQRWRPAPFAIGAGARDDHRWRGAVHELTLWDRALSAAEVREAWMRSPAGG